jgi:tetratricopeptide (TPR) repeat protein
MRGVYYMERNKASEALDDLNKAVKITQSAKAFYYRGALLYDMKKTDDACSDLKKAKELGYAEAKKKADLVCPQ